MLLTSFLAQCLAGRDAARRHADRVKCRSTSRGVGRTSPRPDDARPGHGGEASLAVDVLKRLRQEATGRRAAAVRAARRTRPGSSPRRSRRRAGCATSAARPGCSSASSRCCSASSGCSGRRTTIVGPVVAGTIVATVAMPIVSSLARHMPRAAAAALVLLGLVALAVRVGVLVIGGITAQRDSISDERLGRRRQGRDLARTTSAWTSPAPSSAKCERRAGRPADLLDARPRRDQRHQRA